MISAVARQRGRVDRPRQRVEFTDVQLWMQAEDAVREQVTQTRLRPAAQDQLRGAVEIRARVDVVSDAARDDRQDRGGALAAEVEPGEKPVFSTLDQPAQLALAAIVGELDVAVAEEQGQPLPLSMQVAESSAERRLRGNDGAVLVDPGAKLVDQRLTVFRAPPSPGLGVVARDQRGFLDLEESGDLLDPIESQAVA